jgi:hypothetical protein
MAGGHTCNQHLGPQADQSRHQRSISFSNHETIQTEQVDTGRLDGGNGLHWDHTGNRSVAGTASFSGE